MGDELENRIHATVTVVFDEIKKQSEPCDPINYITFIVGNILYGICYGGK